MDAVYHLSVKNNKGDAFFKLFSLKEGGGWGWWWLGELIRDGR